MNLFLILCYFLWILYLSEILDRIFCILFYMPFQNKISTKEYINSGYVLTWTQYTYILGPKLLIWDFMMSQIQFCDIEIITVFIKKKSL